MLELQVPLPGRAYPILIGQGLLTDGTTLASHVTAQDILLVSNVTVAPLYAPAVLASLVGSPLLRTLCWRLSSAISCWRSLCGR